jgi:predicted regulator of Ras-like GTPase activity (Roadblock/LC7/MglB family)
MAAPNLVILESDHERLVAVLNRLREDANAKLTFLLDKNGQQLARSGDLEGVDPTSLASLTAGNVAATDGLAQLVGEKEFSILFHEGERDNLHINVIAAKTVLVVRFDERSSLGLVRLRVKQATGEIAEIILEILNRSEQETASAVGSASAFGEITDEDIDALFG